MCTVDCSLCTVYRQAVERARGGEGSCLRVGGGASKNGTSRSAAAAPRAYDIAQAPAATRLLLSLPPPHVRPPTHRKTDNARSSPTPPPPPPPILNLSTSDRRPSAESVSLTGRATFPPPRARRAVRAYTSATMAVGEEATHEELLHGGGGTHHHHRRLLRRRRRCGLVVTVSGRRFVVP